MPPPITLVLATVVMLAMVGAGISAFLSIILGMSMGFDADQIQSMIRADMRTDERVFVRLMLSLNHIFTFVFPGVLALWLFCRRNNDRALRFGMFDESPVQYLKSGKMPNLLVVFIAILLIVSSLPLVHYLYGINRLLPLPDWAISMENQTNEAIKGILKMDSVGELFANLAIMALIPAVGEELIFRGIVQQQIQRLVPQPFWAILIAGAIFSAIHMQFEGFLPRWLLGCMLGWLFWQTNNFWVPVAAHFFNNAFQVVGQYLFFEKISSIDFEQDLDVPGYGAIISLFLVIVASRLIKHFSSPIN